MSNFYMTIGIPGCGKSTWAENFVKDNTNTTIISSDNIRQLLFGDINEQSHNDTVFKHMKTSTIDNLNNNVNVIYDATNINRKRRTNFLKELPTDTVKIAVLFTTPYSECVNRNNSRDRVVPIDVINKFYYSFQIPYYSEGFDKIIVISDSDTQKTAVDNLYDTYIKSLNISHDNPHHTATLGRHCSKAFDYVKIISKRENLSESDKYILSQSAFWHDIGKLKTKTFINSKGVETSIAHYYNHENISAYDYLSAYVNANNADTDTYLLISFLINMHMIFFSGEKAINKIKESLDERTWKLLELLHECDSNAD